MFVHNLKEGIRQLAVFLVERRRIWVEFAETLGVRVAIVFVQQALLVRVRFSLQVLSEGVVRTKRENEGKSEYEWS